MPFEVVLRREAEIDLDEIFVWYEEQKVELGFDFLLEFEAILSKISRNPHYASFLETGVRSASLRHFPYEIIYRLDEAKGQVRIIAILHQHRDPNWFRKRFK